jgi:hypothetical protein
MVGEWTENLWFKTHPCPPLHRGGKLLNENLFELGWLVRPTDVGKSENGMLCFYEGYEYCYPNCSPLGVTRLSS